jgi:Holliday junction resolvase RusA-like endonuclease
VSSITITIFYSTHRKTDLTNTAEGIMDLLKECGILKDDNYKVVPRLFLYGEYRKGLGGAKITIIPQA